MQASQRVTGESTSRERASLEERTSCQSWNGWASSTRKTRHVAQVLMASKDLAICLLRDAHFGSFPQGFSCSPCHQTQDRCLSQDLLMAAVRPRLSAGPLKLWWNTTQRIVADTLQCLMYQDHSPLEAICRLIIHHHLCNIFTPRACAIQLGQSHRSRVRHSTLDTSQVWVNISVSALPA